MTSTHESMIERVARALYDGPIPWEAVEEGSKNIMRNDARAAIAALREPTEGMLAVIKPEPVHLYADRDEEFRVAMHTATLADQMAVRQMWRAMIDHILSEQERT